MEVLNIKSVDTEICWTEISVYASSKSVHVKCHPVALAALHSTELCHTHSHYTGSSPQLWSTTKSILESISVFVVYKTTTRLVVLQPGGDLQEAVAQIVDENTCRSSPQPYVTNRMICTGYPCASNGLCNVRVILLINLCVKFYYFFPTQTIILITPV